MSSLVLPLSGIDVFYLILQKPYSIHFLSFIPGSVMQHNKNGYHFFPFHPLFSQLFCCPPSASPTSPISFCSLLEIH